jgi:hypothetical protein
LRRVICLLALAISWPAWAIDIGPCRFASPCVSVSGQIMPGDAAKFAATTKGYPAGTFVFLRGPGGNAAEALEMGDIIWARGFNTAVSPRNGPCASACAILFLTGRHSVVGGRSILVFHMGVDPVTGETCRRS